MKIQILSDLHLEVSRFDPIKTDAEVVVLAGDIGKGSAGVDWAARMFPDQQVIYLAGNHESYFLDINDVEHAIRDEAFKHKNVELLNNSAFIFGDVRFLGCTLWMDFMLFGEEEKPWAIYDAKLYLNDFKTIRNGSRKFSVSDSIERHKHSLCWLESQLATPFDGKTVVVTHHLPSMLSVPDRFKDSQLSACFASNLDHLFGKMDMWVHGHSHDNVDYMANGTRVVCNPRGYITYSGTENFYFNPTFTVEI